MEHRLGARTPVTLAAHLRDAGGRRLSCDIRDLGRHGMFVHTAAPHCLTPNTLVEIEFTLSLHGREDTQRIDALIIHARHDGVGVMFLRDADARLQPLYLACAA